MSRGFRVWDMASECYLPVSRGGNDGVLGITIDGTGIIYLEDGEVNVQLAGVSSVIIEQDTGLKDKNGEKIYDGDIVKVTEWVDDENLGFEDFLHIAKVLWLDRYAQFGTNYSDNISDEITEDFFEVIGNIHENPELLGGGK